jgi:hypothetical protein
MRKADACWRQPEGLLPGPHNQRSLPALEWLKTRRTSICVHRPAHNFTLGGGVLYFLECSQSVSQSVDCTVSFTV